MTAGLAVTFLILSFIGVVGVRMYSFFRDLLPQWTDPPQNGVRTPQNDSLFSGLQEHFLRALAQPTSTVINASILRSLEEETSQKAVFGVCRRFRPLQEQFVPEIKLVQSPSDLPGPRATIPALILVLECSKCRAHGYKEADAAPLCGASCPSER
jgi:hypothetical protein